jgi:biotin-dependent carboxylase-like uncharacterized protein
MMTGLIVLRPGLFTTVQDLGRPGHRAFGVPAGGAFDSRSAALANALLGNASDAAVLEITLNGGTLEAACSLALALAGAPIEATVRLINGDKFLLATPVAFTLQTGARLELGPILRGARAYLAVAGGWQTPVVLGSRSSETPLRAGEFLPSGRASRTPTRHPSPTDDPFEPSEQPIRVVDGVDAVDFVPGESFRVSAQSNRMGLRLEGPEWKVPVDPDRLSTPVAPGAVQVAGGAPLILGVAGGTMGGYPHVAHVISADLGRVAQARPGDLLQFERVTLSEARRLDRESRREWARRLGRIAVAARDGLAG